jgi:hypothetical protein
VAGFTVALVQFQDACLGFEQQAMGGDGLLEVAVLGCGCFGVELLR